MFVHSHRFGNRKEGYCQMCEFTDRADFSRSNVRSCSAVVFCIAVKVIIAGVIVDYAADAVMIVITAVMTMQHRHRDKSGEVEYQCSTGDKPVPKRIPILTIKPFVHLETPTKTNSF